MQIQSLFNIILFTVILSIYLATKARLLAALNFV